MKIAIIGMGHVGYGMADLFQEAIHIDPPKGIGDMSQAAHADLAIVCVPTPAAEDGSCDTSIVERTVAALDAIGAKLILIKSTVTPGTTELLNERLGTERIVFSPEYMGESAYYTPPQYPDPNSPLTHGFVILGGARWACSEVADLLLPVMGPTTRIRFMLSAEAELVKYAENSFFALKVSYANELRRICEAAGANYHVVREGWIDDPRVGSMHTAAFKQQPGFSGKCLPKDTLAFVHYCRRLGIDPLLLQAAIDTNKKAR